MRHCYTCDAPIAGSGFRREVKTGSSTVTHVGKKSRSQSSGTKKGLRTVCEACAAKIDKAKRLKIILIAAAILLWLAISLLSGN